MMQAFAQANTAISQYKSLEDYQRADIEAILAVKVREFLEGFDTVKAYSLTKEFPDEGDRTGAHLKALMDEAVDGLDGISHYAGAIRSGEVHSWPQ